MKNKKNIINNFKVINTIRKIVPSQIPLIVTNSILKSIQSIANILMFKYIFNMLTNEAEFIILIQNICIFFSINITILIINIILERVYIEKNKRIVVGHFQKLLLDKSVKLELECFENMEYYDEFQKSKEQVERRIENIQETLSNFILSILGISAFFSLIITMEPMVILFSFVSVIISLFWNNRAINNQYRLYEKITPLERKIDYFLKIGTESEYAKEVRTYPQFISSILSRFDANLLIITKITKEYSKKYSGILVLQNTIIQSVNMISVIYIIRKALLKYITMGDFIALTGSNQKLIDYISTLFRVIPEIYENGIYLDSFFNFLEYEVKVFDGNLGEIDKKNIEIRIDKVCYVYPKTDIFAIKGLSMTIKQGEKIAIVGENGAGKSTFIKLLCRLYDPTSGSMYFNGNLYKNLKINNIRENMSILFQDYKMYSLPIIDNILMNSIENEDCDSLKVKRVLQKLKMLKRIECCKNGLFTDISREFSNDGTLFSGGEEQRIAISRTFCQEKNIFIFDEPLSKIDPVSENEIFDLLLEICDEKTLILISHHLSNLSKMDKIYFFEKGCIKEAGSHYELIEKKGLYYKMYMKQLEGYKI